jgi:hypothetical protein
MSVCCNYTDSFKYSDVCSIAKRHVLEILGIDDYTVICRTYTCPDSQLNSFLNSTLPDLGDAVGVDHPLYVALTQQNFEDFRQGIMDYDTLACRLSFLCGLHDQNSCVSLLDDDTVRLILARAF